MSTVLLDLDGTLLERPHHGHPAGGAISVQVRTGKHAGQLETEGAAEARCVIDSVAGLPSLISRHAR